MKRHKILSLLCVFAAIGFAGIALASTTAAGQKAETTILGQATTTTSTASVFKGDTEALTLKASAAGMTVAIKSYGKEQIGASAFALKKEQTIESKGSSLIIAASAPRFDKFASATALGVLVLTDIVIGSQTVAKVAGQSTTIDRMV